MLACNRASFVNRDLDVALFRLVDLLILPWDALDVGWRLAWTREVLARVSGAGAGAGAGGGSGAIKFVWGGVVVGNLEVDLEFKLLVKTGALFGMLKAWFKL